MAETAGTSAAVPALGPRPLVKQSLAPLVVYLLAFFAAWTLYVAFAYPLVKAWGTDSFAFALVNTGIRLPIWILPVFFYVHAVKGVEPLDYLKLTTFPRRAVLVTAGIMALDLLSSVFRYGLPDLSHANVTWNSILSSSFAVGFVEEIPFRGLVFQELQDRYGFWPGSLGSSFLFLLMHFPGWLLLGMGPKLELVVSVFVIGMILALLLKYTQSLWSGIIAHSFNDMLAVVIFRV